jgi:hypothetical protein
VKILKWGLAAAGSLVLVGVIAFGVLGGGRTASADATPTPTAGPKGQVGGRYEDLLAQKLGITTAQLQAAQKGALDQLIDEAVVAGRLTQDQAAKLKARDAGAPGPRLGKLGGKVRTAVGDVLVAAAKTIGI